MTNTALQRILQRKLNKKKVMIHNKIQEIDNSIPEEAKEGTHTQSLDHLATDRTHVKRVQV